MPDQINLITSEPLSNLAKRIDNETFYANAIFPQIKVAKPEGKYYVFGREQFTIDQDVRRPFSASNRVDYALSTASYSTQEYSLEHGIDWKMREYADQPLDLDEQGVRLITEKLALSKDNRALAFLTAGNIPNNATLLASGGGGAGVTLQWNEATSKPQQVFANGVDSVIKNAGIEANAIFMSPEVAKVLQAHADVIDQRKYTDNKLINTYGLPEMLWGLKVVVIKTTYNSANRGQAAVMGYLMGKNVLIAYVNPNPSLQAKSFGYTFSYQFPTVRTWKDERAKADFVETSEDYVIKIVSAEAGYLVINAIA